MIESEKDQSSPKPGSRIPEEARVPKLNSFDPEWQRAPAIAVGSTLRAQARMKEVAEKIRGGSKTHIPKLAPSGVGTSARGQQPATCWLTPNRLDWFGAQPPSTGAIGGDLPTALHNEFCSPLSAIVGGVSVDLTEAESRRFVSWADVPERSSPNRIPNLAFVVRSTRPASVPLISTVQINKGSQSVPQKVLLNGGAERSSLAPGERPSLFIDFLVTQRAVALEFGYIGPEDHIDHDNVRLIAYDPTGEEIIESNAEVIQQPRITVRSLFVVGVRDMHANIATVELRFENLLTDSVAIVSRIWHEALPPAAIRQGTISNESGPGAFAPPPPAGVIQIPPLTEIPFPGSPYPIGSERVRIPFHCDHAVVMLRGFKLEFLDQRPHEVRRIEVDVNPRRSDRSTETAPGVFEVERGGSITLEATGSLESGEPRASGSRLLIYYTLIAWDSEQMDLVTAHGQQIQSMPQDTVFAGHTIRVADPCSVPAAERVNRDPTTVCGPLLGATQGFEFRMPQDQEVDFLRLAIGAMGGEHTDDDFDEDEMELPHLDRRANAVD